MRGQTVIGVNLMTFIKLIVLLGILAIVLYAIVADQNVAKQAIKINDEANSMPLECSFDCEGANPEEFARTIYPEPINL
ncbi:MAG: hypothetical protein HY517_02915 [Candidatus Aenigmarchaeota archaeon]|nr:hypothetical protein [Candidatus Aenigmarchaeota archaeon]